MRPAFEQLTETCLKRNLPVQTWRLAEALAMEERGEHLSIFDINHKKAPTLTQITLRLTETYDDSNDGANLVNWVADGIKTQNNQWVFGTLSQSGPNIF
jgi:hypothetical protein